MTEAPLVSVGIPTFNTVSTLSGLLTNVRTQTYANLEILISDNGSTDGTPQKCRELSALDARIKTFLHPTNNGSAWNFDYLLRKSSGSFFVWAAPGDVWHETYIERCVEVLLKDRLVSLVHSEQQRIDRSGQLVGLPFQNIRNLSDSPSERWRHAISHLELHMAVYGVMRRADAVAIRPVQPSSGSDLVFLAEMSLRGKIEQVPEVLFWKTVPAHGLPDRSARELKFLVSGRQGVGLRHMLPHADMTFEAIRSLRSAQLLPKVRRHLEMMTVLSYFMKTYWSRDLASVLRHILGIETYSWLLMRVRNLRVPLLHRWKHPPTKGREEPSRAKSERPEYVSDSPQTIAPAPPPNSK